MAKTRIKRGSKVYVYERKNYRDKSSGKVKHGKARYLGIEVIKDGKTEIISPKRRFKEFEITKSVRHGDISVLFRLFEKYGLIDLLNNYIPKRGLPAGEVMTSLAINHIIDRNSLNKFSKWYSDTSLDEFTGISSKKLNSSNLSTVMQSASRIGFEGIVDLCIKIFNNIKHLESDNPALIYDITSTFFYSTQLPKARLGYNRDNNDQPQINIGLVTTQNKGLPILFRTYEGNITDVKTVKQLIADAKRVKLNIDAIVLDRGMASKDNVIQLNEAKLKIIGGIPLTSKEAKDLVLCNVSEDNELMRPSGLIYYEDIKMPLFGIPGRAIICFNHTDLERSRTTRLKKIKAAEIRANEILSSQKKNNDLDHIKKELKTAIKGVSDYFKIIKDNTKVTIEPNEEARKNARVRDGKCLIFTTNFEKSAEEIIYTYFGKDVIEKVFNCFKNWLDLQPVRHSAEGNIDVYIFICYLAYTALALYKHHFGAKGWEGVEESIEELGRIRKTTIDYGDEKIDKLTVFTKEQDEIIKKLGFKDILPLSRSL